MKLIPFVGILPTCKVIHHHGGFVPVRRAKASCNRITTVKEEKYYPKRMPGFQAHTWGEV